MFLSEHIFGLSKEIQRGIILIFILTKISKKNWTFYGKNKKQEKSPTFLLS